MRKTLAAVSAALLLLQGPLSSIASADPGLLNIDWSSLTKLQQDGFQRGGFHGGGGGFRPGGGGGWNRQPQWRPPQERQPQWRPPQQRQPQWRPPQERQPQWRPPQQRQPQWRPPQQRQPQWRQPSQGRPGNQTPLRPDWPRRPQNPAAPRRWPTPGRMPDGRVPAGHPQAPVNRRPPVFRHPAPVAGGPARVRGIPQPHYLQHRGVIDRVRRGNHDIRMPAQDDRGRLLPVDHGRPPSSDNARFLDQARRDDGFRRRMHDWDRREHDRDRYYWHDDPWGHRFCHYHDRWGFDWYIWYINGLAISTRWCGGYFWYYDPVWDRWVYLYDGRWWYPDPYQPTVVYVYEGGSYYQYQDATGGVVLQPEAPDAGQPAQPQQDPNEKTYYSQDGTRSVLVTGPNRDAFLYDTANPPSFNPVWIGRDVSNVLFRNDAGGSLIDILVLSDDGTFNIFDPNGVMRQGSTPSAAPQAPSQAPQDPQDPNASNPDGGSGQPQGQMYVPQAPTLAPSTMMDGAAAGSLKDAENTGYTW